MLRQAYTKIVHRGQKEGIAVMLQQKMNRYEYPIKVGKQTITGSYTIKEGVKPLGFKGERLVQRFNMVVLAESEKLNEHEPW